MLGVVVAQRVTLLFIQVGARQQHRQNAPLVSLLRACDRSEGVSFCLLRTRASQCNTTEPSLKRLEINDLSIRLIRSQRQWQQGWESSIRTGN